MHPEHISSSDQGDGGQNYIRVTLDEFDIPMQSETDLPLSELCEAIHALGQPSEHWGQWQVGIMLTYTPRTLL